MAKLLTSEKFEVSLEGTHGIVVPDCAALPFYENGHKRVQMKAFFEGNEISFHGALHRRPTVFMISFGKRYQKELGIFPSDYFDLQLIEDTTEYGVEMPEEFSAVLESDPEALARFKSFTDGTKRSLIYFIIRFKAPQTRIDKALLIAENMKMGITNHRELTKARY